MKKVGIALLVLQVVAVAGGLSSGNFILAQGVNGGADLIKIIGYFAPAMIGVILIVKANKKASPSGTGAGRNSAAAGRDSAVKTRGTAVCPKCGAAVEAGDDFCMYCGNAVKKR